MISLATVAGLCLAVGGPPLIASFGDRLFGNSESLTGKILQQFVLALLFIAVLGIVIFWEEQPLSSIGLHPLRWRSSLWGLIFAGFLSFIYAPLLMQAIDRLGFKAFESGLEKLTPLPIWYLVLAIAIGSIVEEGLYRGYATERLSLLTGSYAIGGLLAAIAFGLAHVPLWGWVAGLVTALSGILLTLFYLWTGDLLSAIVAHIVTDSIGIIIIPAFSDGEQFWKK
ncbi:MAG: CPBP family intramembrane metalloprotease [Oscillatoriaceae cyanobacterium Prado104]|jgi:membrane protease YdiL (CAAX protease family)|nr:CPBP family intramembrane metalloprotease [Oscillatoriaceae cyanobacterium Prado104]